MRTLTTLGGATFKSHSLPNLGFTFGMAPSPLSMGARPEPGERAVSLDRVPKASLIAKERESAQGTSLNIISFNYFNFPNYLNVKLPSL